MILELFVCVDLMSVRPMELLAPGPGEIIKKDLIELLALDSTTKNEAEEWYKEFSNISMEDLFEPFTV